MKIDDSNYKDVLKGFSIVEVSGDSCANCISLLPVLNKIVENRKNLKLHILEVTEYTNEFINRYEVIYVPTILIMYDTNLIAKARGYQPEEILEIWIDAKIEEYTKNMQK